MKPREDLAPLYAAIPNGVDILVTHQPPLGYGDCCDPTNSETPAPLGNPDLLSAIQRIRPRLVICGHIHGGYGRFECQHTTIYNVSVVNDDYELARSPTIIDVDEW
jgi:Icc-related predicted phosphoesterase